MAGRKEWEQSQGRGRKGRGARKPPEGVCGKGGQDTGLSALQHAKETRCK